MTSKAQIEWVRRQPLAHQLAAVEKEWQARADNVVLVADQLWSCGKSQQAIDVIVKFGEDAAKVYENVGKRGTDFGRFTRRQVRIIAEGAILSAAVVNEASLGYADGLDTSTLRAVCKRLGIIT